MKDGVKSVLGVLLLWGCLFLFAYIMANFWYQFEILWAVFVFVVFIGLPVTFWIMQAAQKHKKRKSHL